jgi:hypothetical protein
MSINEERRNMGEDTLDLNRRMRRTESEVGDLKAGQARMEARIDTGFQGIAEQLKHLNAPKPKVNTVGWVSAFIAMLVLIGAVAEGRFSPIEHELEDLQEANRDSIAARLKKEYEHGREDATQTGLTLALERLEARTHEQSQRLAELGRQSTQHEAYFRNVNGTDEAQLVERLTTVLLKK